MERDLSTSFFGEMERSLKKRNDGEPVRFVYDRDIPKKLLSYIVEKNKLPKKIMIHGGRYHNNRDLVSFPNPGSRYDGLRYRNPEPLEHPVLRNHRSILDALGEQDVLLHYPYQSFQYIVDLLREAAVDRHVTSIRVTLYRVADNSDIVNALINAIRNGKKVTVFVEIQARFDEEANIEWTEQLAEEGANVIREIPGIKIHSKLILITRRKGGKRTRYACVGTGNFDESTAKIYTDHALLTSNPAVVDEVREVFRFLERSFKPFEYKNLLVSPFNMEQKLHQMIDTEIKNARKGKDAFIHAKLNGLSQKKIMNRLYEAGKAGVDVKMVIRGVCCLVPGVKEFSSNIEVLSIIDKYLEHSRIYIFCNDNNPLVFISSADWMPRNLEKRVEVAVPILDEELKKELIDYMNIQLEDNVKARVINENQDNSERNSAGSKRVRAQVKIYKYLRKRLKTDNKQ
jgi:polyphosphate kinase